MFAEAISTQDPPFMVVLTSHSDSRFYFGRLVYIFHAASKANRVIFAFMPWSFIDFRFLVENETNETGVNGDAAAEIPRKPRRWYKLPFSCGIYQKTPKLFAATDTGYVTTIWLDRGRFSVIWSGCEFVLNKYLRSQHALTQNRAVVYIIRK